jgi:stage II sporulation protein E
VAYEKGKIILVDLPAYLSSNCIRVNDVLTTLNNLIDSYFDYSSSVSNLDTSRILIANQLSGVSSLLLTLSRELDVDVSVDKKLQEIIKEELCYRGVICFGCVVYNQDIQNKNVSLIVKSDNIVDNIIESVVSKVLNHKVAIVDISQSDMIGGSVVVLKSAPNYEIVFGVKTIKKTSSKVSGDSYSLLKITDDKYMVSICDGMGSGSSASEISKLTLKLIENFYKAGYDNDIILNSINKLLTLTERENYSTLDLCVLDVRQNVYDFVKLGACESIILRDNGEVEIIESSGLPLGVLENIKPHITRRMINPMDIIISVSDGIVDSLKGIDLKTFIKNLNIVNPQTLADELVNFALSKNGGVAVDDMTVIVLRLIEKY